MIDYKSVLIVYNPNALKGKIENYLPQIKQRLLFRYPIVDAMSSNKTDGAFSLAYKNASKYDIVVACGGDGTLHQVVNGVLKSGANSIIGVLPFGTCNDVAHTLQIPRSVNKAIDCLLRLNTTNYDLMFDGEEFITYALATGYLTGSTYEASEGNKKRFGRFAYFLSALKYLFKFKALPITIKCDAERVHGKFNYLMIINGEYAGGFRLNKGDDYDNGKVKFVMIKNRRGPGGFFVFLRLFMFGINNIKNCKNVIIKEAQDIEIENHANAPFTIDGEKVKFLKKNIVAGRRIKIIKK